MNGPEEDRLSVIAHWTVYVCPTCGDRRDRWNECAGTMTEPHPLVEREEVDYVPAEQLRGAVSDLAKIHALAEQLRTTTWATKGGLRGVAREIEQLAAPHLRGQSA